MVYFKEVLPNPAGFDTEGEWIKIINAGEERIDLSGWSISDSSGKTFSFFSISPDARTLLPRKELILDYKITKIGLNNDGDVLTLRSASGEIKDEISYTGPVGDDEIIFAAQFSPETSTPENLTLQNLANIETAISESVNIVPIFTAILISLVFGAGVAMLVKGIILKNEE